MPLDVVIFLFSWNLKAGIVPLLEPFPIPLLTRDPLLNTKVAHLEFAPWVLIKSVKILLTKINRYVIIDTTLFF